MLHEVLLALSGHPSPLLRTDNLDAADLALISPPERQLLDYASLLSDLHHNLRDKTSLISSTSPSTVCRAVSNAIAAVHLAAFQRKILEVEEAILRQDADLVGAYNIVPLTAVISQFTDWIRRLQWLNKLVQFMTERTRLDLPPCQAAELIDRLRNELETGYADIAEIAQSLLQVAETSWLKQTSAWVLHGRKPTAGEYDFFIREDEGEEQGFKVDYDLLPSFVTPSTAASMLFIGVSVNRARSRAGTDLGAGGLVHLASQHHELARLPLPLHSATFSRAITSIRHTLSRTILQKLLPLAKVLEILKVLREFFLIGRGEFAMALTQQADERIRNRWRRGDNLAFERKDTLGTVVVKEGELAAVLARTWSFLASMQGQHAEEDEALELARDLLRLQLFKSAQSATPARGPDRDTDAILDTIVPTPFRNLLFSVPVTLTFQIPSPLDLFLTHSDVQIYTAINSYLLSIRRAHLRLTDLWKITSLRRHHPPPPRAPYGNSKGGVAKTKLLRERWSARSSIMRSTWSTSSAAIFFLGEAEAYLQVEIVEGLWSHFHAWLTGIGETEQHQPSLTSSPSPSQEPRPRTQSPDNTTHQDAQPNHSNHDPQTLSTAHRLYLSTLVRRLLLTRAAFTTPLYNLLIHTDHLVALTHRLHGVWTASDLETDEGVVDAFANLEAEEKDVRTQLRSVEQHVKFGIEDVISALRTLSQDSGFAAEMEGEDRAVEESLDDEDVNVYRPKRVGGIDRLLMKLDFGGWFEAGDRFGRGPGGLDDEIL